MGSRCQRQPETACRWGTLHEEEDTATDDRAPDTTKAPAPSSRGLRPE
ncbi:hypothetical protein Ae168Ps1_2040 [Pseudonocardia sp. Ae168_Ps1]|nr:hypothetical protein Ae150APs1_2036 [Pseudonocardia sp. Ae150A_Ps1]OLL79634.1 hypothetical protein Ae168Ps1_2040 [Pseudonocardia sp. Ae168_Ps1]OLL86228.1 hypothetical protein Ae263Ps1_3283c [Pseudonocardia sp. Ae263_Ps1]OLL93741.1 hypothetical protein Ae356Ps1_3638 [Pseudonocardia sp. Ae356_Ps1]